MPDAIPPVVCLAELMSDVRDQGARPTCVSFAATAAHELALNCSASLSEEALHWGTRHYGTCKQGTTLAAADAALWNYGQTEAHAWPYNPMPHEDVTEEPPATALEARPWRTCRLRAIPPDIGTLRGQIMIGHGVVAILQLEAAFFNPVKGRVDLPAFPRWINANHAVLLLGYSEGDQSFILRNSWGKLWGENGYCRISYAFVAEALRGAAVIAQV